MTLKLRISDRAVSTKFVALSGRLDAATCLEFDERIAPALASDASVIVLDMIGLTYISSAGLRSIFRAYKTLEERNGALLLVNVQPAVQKVLDIVRALPPQSVFESVAELDSYLDYMQRKA